LLQHTYAYRQRHQLHAHQHCAVTPAFLIQTQTHSLTPTGRGSAAKNGCHKTKQLYGMHNSHPRCATAEPVDHKTTADGRKDPSSEQRTAGPPQCILAGSTAFGEKALQQLCPVWCIGTAHVHLIATQTCHTHKPNQGHTHKAHCTLSTKLEPRNHTLPHTLLLRCHP
jgi:hypothetical protein